MTPELRLLTTVPVVALVDAPVDGLALALANRGFTYEQQGDIEKAVADYDTVVELDDAPAEQVAKVLISKGMFRRGWVT